MATSDDCGWLLYLSLAAKCGDPHRLVGLAAVLFAAFAVTSLLHWAAPGGPAWGRYWWTRRAGLGIIVGSAIPGPRGLPVLGSMGLMTGLAHRKLAAAAGETARRRLMAFSVGETRFVVTSDPDVARELLGSAAFADRPVKESAYGLLFHRAIGFAPYGVYWRALRRVASTHLFSPRQVAASAAHRAVIARQMLHAIDAGGHAAVVARRFLKRASLHNVMWSVFGRRYDEPEAAESEEAVELKALVDEGYDLLGQLNYNDHLPWLARFDLQRTRARCAALVPRVNRFVGRIIEEHRRGKLDLGDDVVMDFTDVLLSLQGSDRLSDADMIAVLWEMIFRGTDTVAVLMEWVLARLVMHPDVQRKVHEELDRVVGPGQTVVESDTASLVYLHAVIKEVLRLHPPGPLLSWARLATSDVHVGGYLVPAGTTAMVNMWGITHDAKVWSDPMAFEPGRFMEASDSCSEVSVMGSDLRLAPFGSGRRVCPGKSLAMATVGFWVATLLHEYEWLPATASSAVDLSEVLRLSCEMATPLQARLRPRHAV